jgi:hypothetical protein
MTFSVPEMQDLRERSRTLSAFGDFSTIGFTMVGLGEPREVQAGVVGGSYFEVMGLRPLSAACSGPVDDGPRPRGRWSSPTASGGRPSPAIPPSRPHGEAGDADGHHRGRPGAFASYPAETEIIANVVTSPHHLSRRW